MQKFVFHSHTADTRLILKASTPVGLFKAGLNALNYLLAKSKNKIKGKKQERKIKLHADNLTQLLVDFLSEVLTYSYLNKTVYSKIKIIRLNKHYLEAVLTGRLVSAFSVDIKGVTYHEAKIVKDKQGNYQTVIVLDL